MAQTASFTGRQGTVTLGGTFIPITGWSMKISKKYADATDSSTYDAPSGQVWEFNAPGTINMEGTIKGNFDPATTGTAFVQGFKSDSSIQLTLGYNRSTNLCTSSPFIITDVDFTVEIGQATMVSFTASVKSNGIPTLP